MANQIGNIMVDIEVRPSRLRRWVVAILVCAGLRKMAYAVLKSSIHVSQPYFKRVDTVD